MSKFWITQLVDKGEYPEYVTGKIKKLDSNAINMFESHLPENLIWTSLDVNVDNTLNIIYEFLKDNYVANEMYGLEYSKEFLIHYPRFLMFKWNFLMGKNYFNYNKKHINLSYFIATQI